MKKRSTLVGRGAIVVLVWAALNAVAAGALFVFHSRSEWQQLSIYWSAVTVLVLSASALWLAPRRVVVSQPQHHRGQTFNGAPAAALAGACLIGGLAWVFGVLLAYFCIPLLLFCLARWRVERRVRKEVAL